MHGLLGTILVNTPAYDRAAPRVVSGSTTWPPSTSKRPTWTGPSAGWPGRGVGRRRVRHRPGAGRGDDPGGRPPRHDRAQPTNTPLRVGPPNGSNSLAGG